MAFDERNLEGCLLALGVAGLAGLGCGGSDERESASATSLTGIFTTVGDTSNSGGTVDGDPSAEGGSADGESGGGLKLDVASSDLGGNGGDCPGGGGMMGEDVEFSYIWIANSPAGTVSKKIGRASCRERVSSPV